METTQTILLVEDDPNDAALFRRAVQKSGLKVELTVAEDGEQAIQTIRSHLDSSRVESRFLPRLVLLDLKMPRVSGIEVLEWIRSQAALRHLPVVVFTSSCEASDIRRAYELGANSYLVKPVAYDELQHIVQILHEYWLVLNIRSEPA